MNKVLSVLGGILSFIICVVLFIFQTSFLLFTTFRVIISDGTITKLIEKVDVVEILEMNSETMSEVYKVTGSIGLTVDDTNKVLNSRALKGFISEYLSSNIKNISEDTSPVLTTENLDTLLNDVEKETNITINKKEEIITLINENSVEIDKTLNFSNTIKTEMDENTLSTIKSIMSLDVFIGFGVIFVVLYLFIALFRWSFYKPLMWYGITSIVSSSIFLIPILLIKSALPIVLTGEYLKYQSMIEKMIKTIQGRTLICSLIMVALGIVMIIVHNLIKKNKCTDESDKIENAL